MAIAGKVAITPGGEWSLDVAYDKLIVVTFGNNVYLSIKPSTGIEPTNEEYWMLLIENVTQEQYDEIINGTTPVGNANKLGGKSASEYALSKNFESGDKYVFMQTDKDQMVDNKMYRLILSNDALYLYSSTDGGNSWGNPRLVATTADLANYVPLDGSKAATGIMFPVCNGNVAIAGDKGYALLVSQPDVSDNSKGDSLMIRNITTTSRGIYYRQIDDTGLHEYPLFHTGTKPTGSYTGNGSATERIIATGGSGQSVMVWGNSYIGIGCNYIGGFSVRVSSGTGNVVPHGTNFWFDGSSIRIETDSEALNASGVTYYYHVL